MDPLLDLGTLYSSLGQQLFNRQCPSDCYSPSFWGLSAEQISLSGTSIWTLRCPTANGRISRTLSSTTSMKLLLGYKLLSFCGWSNLNERKQKLRPRPKLKLRGRSPRPPWRLAPPSRGSKSQLEHHSQHLGLRDLSLVLKTFPLL